MAGVLFAEVLAQANTLTAPELPAPVFADTEVSTNVAMMAWAENSRRFLMTLQFDATPSNNVQVAFGADESPDGNLSDEETGLALGWDCGKWFVALDAVTNRFTASPTDPSTRKELTLRMRLGADGVPRTVELTEGNTPLAFSGSSFLPVPPAWMYSKDWNRLKIIARGTDARNERIMVQLTNDAFLLLLR